jgi:putative membrane protein
MLMKGGALALNWRLLEAYTIWDLWNPALLFLLVLIGTVYWMLTGALRSLFSEASPVHVGQRFLFFSGLFILFFALGSPLHVMGHDFLFSAHMLEQALVYMAAPPLLLLGTPGWLVRPLFRLKLKRVSAVITNPFVAVLSFNGIFSLYHLPVVFDAVNGSAALHTFIHLILMVTSISMWWMIFSPLPVEGQLTHLKKMGYVILNGLVLYPACAAIIFAGVPLYATYREAALLVSFLTPLNDQQLGGVIMKLVQEGIFIVTLGVIFYSWYRKENIPLERFDKADV